MTTGKKLHWFVIFGLLTPFTVLALKGGGEPVRPAMAKMASESKNAKRGFVVVKTDEHKTSFLKKFARVNDRGVICAADSEDMEALTELYGAESDSVSIDGKDIPVITISAPEADPGAVKQFLRAEEGQCRFINERNVFYLLFSANMS